MELLRSVIEAVSMAFEGAGVLVLFGGTLAVIVAYVSGRPRGQPRVELYRGLRTGLGRQVGTPLAAFPRDLEPPETTSQPGVSEQPPRPSCGQNHG